MTVFNIYLINELPDEQTVYGFLGTPQPDLPTTVDLYYSSNVLATLPPQPSPQQNVWSFGVAYFLYATAGVQPVGPAYVPQSSDAQLVNADQLWKANYYQATGQRRGPDLQLIQSEDASGVLSVQTNVYDKGAEGINQWYAGLGISLPSSVGYARQLWSPDPNQFYSIQTTPLFYVYKGSYVPKTYILSTKIPPQAQAVQASNLDDQGRCTVTLNRNGLWSIAPGPPAV